jgi:hypothetical protein
MAEEQKTENADAPAGTEAKVEDGFGSAFAERASGTGPEAADKAADSEPADKAGSEAPPAKAADESDTSGTAKQADPWENMTPEQQRLAYERLQASERSQRGRVGALTKKLTTLTRTAEPPSKKDTEEQPKAKAEEDTATKAADLDARLEAVADEYGDINGPIIDAIKGIRAEIAELKPKVDKVDLDSDSEELAKAYAVLEGKHPDYATIGADPAFNEWASTQPEKVKELLVSYDPDEVSLGLSLYKAERKVTQAAAGEGDQGKDGGTATGDRRERQLDGSRQVTHRGAPAATGVPDEFGAAFKARARAAAT